MRQSEGKEKENIRKPEPKTAEEKNRIRSLNIPVIVINNVTILWGHEWGERKSRNRIAGIICALMGSSLVVLIGLGIWIAAAGIWPEFKIWLSTSGFDFDFTLTILFVALFILIIIPAFIGFMVEGSSPIDMDYLTLFYRGGLVPAILLVLALFFVLIMNLISWIVG